MPTRGGAHESSSKNSSREGDSQGLKKIDEKKGLQNSLPEEPTRAGGQNGPTKYKDQQKKRRHEERLASRKLMQKAENVWRQRYKRSTRTERRRIQKKIRQGTRKNQPRLRKIKQAVKGGARA